jgi:hypothetical protein
MCPWGKISSLINRVSISRAVTRAVRLRHYTALENFTAAFPPHKLTAHPETKHIPHSTYHNIPIGPNVQIFSLTRSILAKRQFNFLISEYCTANKPIFFIHVIFVQISR